MTENYRFDHTAQSAPTTSGHPLLEIRSVRKSFGGVTALDGVSFAVEAGEVHAIVGENGAGKSTLMNILAGVHQADGGEIRLTGQPFVARNPREARENGISIVFQELALFPTLTVDANLHAGKEAARGLRLDHHAMLSSTEATLAQMDIDLLPDDVVDNLSIAQRQWVEIARAVTDDARILILDEPNSALNHHETEVLFNLIALLKARGITFLYISHRLEEVFRIADRITVLRDGGYVGTWLTRETNISQIVSAMVGHREAGQFLRSTRPSDEIILHVDELTAGSRLEPVSFTVRRGEVVGLAGLTGAGVADLLAMIFGLQSPAGGKVVLDGQTVHANTPRDAVLHGIAMVPSDRRGLGLMMNWSVANNVTLAILARLSRLGFLNHHTSSLTTRMYIDRLNIVTDNQDKGVALLSGGNQQKVLLARWLATKPRLLILDDPTRGIDIGAKHEIYRLIDEIAAEGVAVLLTSSEIEEILGLSDRILVFRKHRCIAEIPRHVCDKALLTEFVTGDSHAAAEQLRARLGGDETIADAMKSAVPPPLTTRASESSPVARAHWTEFLRRLYRRREMGVLQALFAVIMLFALITPYFLTASNLLLISRQMAILGILTAGMTFVLASGEVDLSVGWNFNLVMTAMAALIVNTGIDPWIAIPFGLLVGTGVGALNGLLAVRMQLPTIIVTLGTLTVIRGLSLALNGGRTISSLPESTFFQIGSGTLGSVPYMTIAMLLVFAAAAWLFRNTRFARQVLAMGANRQAAERIGIPTARVRILVMAFSGLLCGIAGILGLAFLGAADAQSGSGYELTAIAAAIIGGAKLGGGAGTIWGSLIGIALITAIQNGLALVGLPPAWQIASTGIVIIAAVTIDYLTRARRKSAPLTRL